MAFGRGIAKGPADMTFKFNATTYEDTSVSGDTTYTYRIRAVNDVGPSDWSNEVIVVTIASPDQLTAVAVSNTRVDLMWRDRTGSEDGYAVERRRAGRLG